MFRVIIQKASGITPPSALFNMNTKIINLPKICKLNFCVVGMLKKCYDLLTKYIIFRFFNPNPYEILKNLIYLRFLRTRAGNLT